MLMLMLEHSCFDYDYEQEDDLQQFQPRQILRINNADRRVVVVNDDEIIDAMAFQKIENFDGQFVLVHAYRIQRHQIRHQTLAYFRVVLKMPGEIAMGKNAE